MFDLSNMISAIKEAKPKTSAYDTTAEVRRIDGETAWVHIPGGADETPVRMTVNASAGDTVQVRVSGGDAFIVGNQSAPPTDDKTAITISKTLTKEVNNIKDIAGEAAKIAGDTNQYFWHTESGGAHITEVPKETFLNDPDNGGCNLLARSNGIAIRDGLTELALFSANLLQIGQDSEANVQLSSTAADGSVLEFNAGTTYTPVKIIGKDYVGYINIDNDQIKIIGSHLSTIGGTNIDRLSLVSYGINNQRRAAVVLDAYGTNGRSTVEVLDSGIELSSTDVVIDGTLKDNNDDVFYPQKSGGFTTPTVSASAVTVTAGGYIVEGKHVFVQVRCILSAALNADTARTIFTGLPMPRSVAEVALNILVRSRAGHACRITDTGEMQIVADPDHGISANQNVTITGVYLTV